MIDRVRSVIGSQIALTLGVVVLLVLVVIWRQGATADTGDGAAEDAEVETVSEEAFCDGYRHLASLQSQYVAAPDDTGAEMLQEASDELVALGVPASMATEAREAFLVEIEGVFGSLGIELGPGAVPGATGEEQDLTSHNAFSDWLGEFCPSW